MNFYNDRTDENYTKLYKQIKPILSRVIFKKIYNQDDRQIILDKTLEMIWTYLILFH